jgi:hypothetical protein
MAGFQFLSDEVRAGLDAARDRARRGTGGKLRVQIGDDWFPIRAFDATGFEVDLGAAPRLRGAVELHDGPRHVHSALIVATERRGDAIRYVFKRLTRVPDGQPLDYARETPEVAGLLGG